MLDILKEIQGYSQSTGNDEQKVYKSVPVIGDQLTVERGVNIIQAVQNAFTPEERLEGIHMEIADWHAAVTFLKLEE